MLCASGGVVVRAVVECCALALGVGGVVWDIGGGKFEFCLLFGGWVGGRGEGGEGVLEVLFFVLLDFEGEWLQGGEEVVGQ